VILYAIGNEPGTQIAPTKLIEESDIILQLNGVGAKRVLPFQRVIMSDDVRDSQLAICVNGGASQLFVLASHFLGKYQLQTGLSFALRVVNLPRLSFS